VYTIGKVQQQRSNSFGLSSQRQLKIRLKELFSTTLAGDDEDGADFIAVTHNNIRYWILF